MCAFHAHTNTQVDVELDVAMELFQAADQFGVDRLKRMCESTMLASIEVENAASIFHAADERNAKVRSTRYRLLRGKMCVHASVFLLSFCKLAPGFGWCRWLGARGALSEQLTCQSVPR